MANPNFEFCPPLPDVATRQLSSANEVFNRVIWALFVRELKTRFGTTPWSVISAVLEPIMTWLTFLVLYTALGREGFGDIPISWLLLSGIFTWITIKNIAQKVSYGINVNAHLLNYSLVKPLDLMLARFLLEVFVFVIGISLIGSILLLKGDLVVIHKPLELALAYFLFFLFGFGLGVLQLFVSAYVRFGDLLNSTVMRLLFFTSGVFFSWHTLPPVVKDWALLNPFFQFMEAFRVLFFVDYPPVPLNWPFLVILCLASFFGGLIAIKQNENRLLSRLKQRG
jgi:capsular polysaccharide transport system permease protein